MLKLGQQYSTVRVSPRGEAISFVLSLPSSHFHVVVSLCACDDGIATVSNPPFLVSNKQWLYCVVQCTMNPPPRRVGLRQVARLRLCWGCWLVVVALQGVIAVCVNWGRKTSCRCCGCSTTLTVLVWCGRLLRRNKTHVWRTRNPSVHAPAAETGGTLLRCLCLQHGRVWVAGVVLAGSAGGGGLLGGPGCRQCVWHGSARLSAVCGW